MKMLYKVWFYDQYFLLFIRVLFFRLCVRLCLQRKVFRSTSSETPSMRINKLCLWYAYSAGYSFFFTPKCSLSISLTLPYSLLARFRIGIQCPLCILTHMHTIQLCVYYAYIPTCVGKNVKEKFTLMMVVVSLSLLCQ